MKKIFISFFIIFSTLLFSCLSYASSYTFTASPNESSVNPGDDISISLKISDINAGPYGINAIETTLVYDSNIIESVEFIDKNDWKSTYNPNEGSLHGKLLYSKMVTGVKKNEEIGILKFKIKENLQPFETEIKLLQVTSNDGYELMNNGDKIIKLKYVINNPEPNTPTDENENQPQPEQPKSEEQNPISIIPSKIIEQVQTGDIIWIVILILIIAIILSIILFIIKFIQKGNNSKH